MNILNTTVWVIMDKGRTCIVKGTPRDREIVRLNEKDKKRFLTYSSKAKAIAAFKNCRYYGMGYIPNCEWGMLLDEVLEAVECNFTLTIK